MSASQALRRAIYAATGNRPNLVANGSGQLGDNTNFSAATWVADAAAPSGAAFETLGSSVIWSDALIPVGASREYVQSLSARYTDDGGDSPSLYAYFVPFDADGNRILNANVHPVVGTLTTMAADAEIGDTEITVADASGWADSAHHYCAFDATEDYSDLPNFNLSDNITGISGNVISFASPLTAAWPAGTACRQHYSGATYMYVAAVNVALTDSYQVFSGATTGMQVAPDAPNSTDFWIGARFVKVGWFISQLGTSATVRVGGVSLQRTGG